MAIMMMMMMMTLITSRNYVLFRE